MVSISEEATIPSPLHVVWPFLSDPGLVAACIPGATLLPDQSDGLWRGSIRVKFGPTVAVFRGEAKLTYDHAARTCTIEGRGIDQRGASRALASGVVKASGTADTRLDIDGNFTVTGPLETFANAGGVHVARALLAEFSGNMARVVAERHATSAAPGAPGNNAPSEIVSVAEPAVSTLSSSAATSSPPRAAAELNAAKILWSAFVSWLRSLISKGTKS
jgi:carbon monoxide dehydrogenase subunit G